MSNSRDKNIEKFADVFKALSNPNRLKIFMKLTSCCRPGTVTSINPNTGAEGCACVGELGQDLDIVPSTIYVCVFKSMSFNFVGGGEVKNGGNKRNKLDVQREIRATGIQILLW